MRKMLRRGVPLAVLVLLTATACSFGSDDKAKEMDAPQVSYIENQDELEKELDEEQTGDPANVEETEEEQTEENDKEVAELIEREIYLFDQNGYVVPQTIQVPKQEGVLKQSLEYLVIGGPVSEQLPNGFQAVLPAGTEMTVNLKDGVATADFSEEFRDYHPNMERQVLEAITWTLTQFDSIEKVKIQINGYDQEVMPHNKTPIGEGVSREDGINLETAGLADIINTSSVTLYFLGSNGTDNYYVPVTRMVSSKSDNSHQLAVEQLLTGPTFKQGGSLLSDIRKGVSLLEEPIVKDGVLTLNFSEQILSEKESSAVSTEVLNMLALTLLQVEGEEEVLNEEGEAIETVSRPSNVNAGKY